MLYAIKWAIRSGKTYPAKTTIGVEVFSDIKKRTAYKKSMGKDSTMGIELVQGNKAIQTLIKRVNENKNLPNVTVLPVQYHS
jgi:hypothetical protein